MSAAISEPWLPTVSGRRILLMNPDPSAITIEDIAHAGGNLCRYCGHSSSFVSIDEHAVLVSRLVEALIASPFGPALTEGMDAYELDDVVVLALLHDAAESYVGEVTAPLKKLLGETYAALERLWSIAIGVRFLIDFPATLPPIVKLADAMALFIERRDAHVVAAARVAQGADPLWAADEKLTDEHRAWIATLPWARAEGLSPGRARHRFLERWVTLGGAVSHAVVPPDEPIASSEYHEQLVKRALVAFDRALAAQHRPGESVLAAMVDATDGGRERLLDELRARFAEEARNQMAQAATVYEAEIHVATESWR